MKTAVSTIRFIEFICTFLNIGHLSPSLTYEKYFCKKFEQATFQQVRTFFSITPWFLPTSSLTHFST
jgi:hypothetical protein